MAARAQRSEFIAVRRGAVRCGAVRCGAVRCGAARCGVVRCGAVRCGAVRCGAARCGAVRCGAVRCGAVRCGAKGPPHPFDTQLKGLLQILQVLSGDSHLGGRRLLVLSIDTLP